MGKRLYVGSLPFETTDQQLQELFAAHGKVDSAKVIMDKMTGRSKGFGFVEMGTDEEAKVAIEKMNGAAVGSRKIVVNEARPMEDRKGGGGQGGFNRGGGGGFGGGRRDGGHGGGRDGGRDGGFGGGFGGNRDDFGGGNRGRRDHRGGGRRQPDSGDYGNRW